MPQYRVYIVKESDFLVDIEAATPEDAAQDAVEQGLGTWEFQESNDFAYAVDEIQEDGEGIEVLRIERP